VTSRKPPRDLQHHIHNEDREAREIEYAKNAYASGELDEAGVWRSVCTMR
jgi:hypothetical protein